MVRLSLALSVIVLVGCNAKVSGGLGDGGHSHVGDGGTNGDGSTTNGDGATGTTCSPTVACPTGERCFGTVCIPDNGTCADDDHCENDTYCTCAGSDGGLAGCDGGVCVPYGTPPRGDDDPTCQQGFSAGAFAAPSVKCQWTSPDGNSDVVMTPLVVDLDKDGKPEIVFVPYESATLTAIHGADCTPMWTSASGIQLQNFGQLAAADLDGDGYPEIVGITGDGIAVFDHTGALLASGQVDTSAQLGSDCSGPAIADVDNVAPPEIVVDGTVFRYTAGQSTLTTLFSKPTAQASWGNLSVFADLDGDHKPEVIVGTQVLDGITGADKTPSNLAALGIAGYPAIADFNGDGKPDIVNVQSTEGGQMVSIFDYANNTVIFGPYGVAGGGWGGPPTVGDYDGDGVPDIGLASTDHYYVYATKCAKTPKPADCTGTDPGVLWEKPTHDLSSGGTASSTFDFNGDGISEVVYRDECWLRVYNGPDGKAIFAKTITSGTCLEYPVIADVDNDGHADLVVPSDRIQESFTTCDMTPEADTQTPWGGYTSGIFVLQDPMNRWVPSRPLWTSHGYHITEIKDDLSVPTTETNSWTATNSYRKNVQGGLHGAGGVDATGKSDGSSMSTTCSPNVTLSASLCNRGGGPATNGLTGTFYATDPRLGGATPICTVTISASIAAGTCSTATCNWTSAPSTPTGVWLRVNDDGMNASIVAECKHDNDILYLPDANCTTKPTGPID